MPVILRRPDKKVSMSKEELKYFVVYLDTCKGTGFSGVNHFHMHELRERLLRFSLLTLSEKALNKLLNATHQLPSKKLNLPVNESEELLLNCMFQRVDCGPYMLALQSRIALSLRPAYSATEIERKWNES